MLITRVYKAENPPFDRIEDIGEITIFLCQHNVSDDNGNIVEQVYYDNAEQPRNHDLSTFDSDGRLLRMEERTVGEAEPDCISEYTYDASGKMLKDRKYVAGEELNAIDYSYDMDGRLVKETDHDQETEERISWHPKFRDSIERIENYKNGRLVCTITNVWERRNGEPFLAEQSEMHEKETSHENYSRIRRFYDPKTTPNNVAEEVYNRHGNFLEEARELYDEKGNLLRLSRHSSEDSDSIPFYYEEYVYDKKGLLIHEKCFVDASSGHAPSRMPGETLYSYDGEGRVHMKLEKHGAMSALLVYEYEKT